MRSRMVTAVLFVALLSFLAGDFTMGCGQGYVYGPVTQKYGTTGDRDQYTIAVAGQAYMVPADFWQRVQVGDTVKFDGKNWTIVKHEGQTTPANSNPAAPAPAPYTP
jgi:hypothetical protein